MEINKRIEQLKEHLGLSNSEFSNRIDVQPSALSHIFSERNRPSVEFILKIKNAFPAISLDWLLLGKGSIEENGKLHSPQEFNFLPPTPTNSTKEDEGIEKIIFFYKNGSCKIYNT